MFNDMINVDQRTDLEPKKIVTSNQHTLGSILSYFKPFPKLSVMIGLCEDGLPFMLALGNPKSGSILMAGYDRYELTQTLKTMVISGCQISKPHDINIVLITKNPHDYRSLTNYPHILAILSPFESSTGETVIEIASVSEQRRSGRERGAAIMLMVDGFQDFSNMLGDFSVFLNLKTLVASGPNSTIWPIITTSVNMARNVNDQLGGFGTLVAQHPNNVNTYTVEVGKSRFDFSNLTT